MIRIGKQMKRVGQCRNCRHFKEVTNKATTINWCKEFEQETSKRRMGCAAHLPAHIKNNAERLSGPGRRSPRRKEA